MARSDSCFGPSVNGCGAIILAFVIPVHIQLWAKLPVWYQLVFLGSQLPLVMPGAAFTRTRFRAGPVRVRGQDFRLTESAVSLRLTCSLGKWTPPLVR